MRLNLLHSFDPMSLTDAMLLEAYRDPKDIFISIRSDGHRGEGTEVDPYNASTQELFDGLMRGFMAQNLEFITIHLGPGEFETKGTAPYDVNQGWEMRRGWKIIGSGIDVTVLKVVGAVEQSGLIIAIGAKDFTTSADYAEVSDLTVDCNLPIGEDPPNTATAAVNLKGNHVRVRRVRAIRFGTYQLYPFTPPDPRNQPECFVISVGGRAAFLPEPADCVIEDCIVEHRADIDGGNNTTCLALSSGEDPRTGIMQYHRGGVIRRCVVDGVFEDGTMNLTQPVWGLSGNGGIGSVVEGNRVFNCRAGGPYQDSFGTRDMVVRGNHYHNTLIGIWQHMGGTSSFKRGSPLARYDSNQAIAICTTFGPHGLAPDDVVEISGAVAVDFPDGIEIVSTLFNGDELTVLDNPAPTTNTFAYQMPSDDPPQSNAFGAFVYKKMVGGVAVSQGFGFSLVKKGMSAPNNQIAVFTAEASHGLIVGDQIQITGAVMWDGNQYQVDNPFNGSFTVASIPAPPQGLVQFEYALSSVPYADPFPSVIAKRSSPSASYFGVPMARNGDLVTFTTVYPHGLLVGEGVDIREARINNLTSDTPYNGSFDIESVAPASNPTRFSFRLKTPASNLPEAAGSPRFAGIFQVGSLICENNVIELAPASVPQDVPVGIYIEDDAANRAAPYVFQRVVLRDNIIRMTPGTSDLKAWAILIESAKGALIENNTIDLPKADPLGHSLCESVEYFNNRTPTGQLVLGTNQATQRHEGELQTDIDDVLAMAL